MVKYAQNLLIKLESWNKYYKSQKNIAEISSNQIDQSAVDNKCYQYKNDYHSAGNLLVQK